MICDERLASKPSQQAPTSRGTEAYRDAVVHAEKTAHVVAETVTGASGAGAKSFVLMQVRECRVGSHRRS